MISNFSYISVICPIYNEEKYISQCIDSILEQDYPKNKIEVLFVDGISTDKTRLIIRKYQQKFPFIYVLDNQQRIVPVAMNIGIRASKGDVIIRLDAHASYPSNYFTELVENLGKLNADNVGGICRTLPARNTVVCQAISVALSSSFGMGNSYFRIGTSNIMKVDTVPFGCFRRDVFERIGYFDEELIRNQDDELNGRINKNGGKIYLLPHLIIDYYARDKIGKVSKMFYQYGLFKPLVNKKLGGAATYRQFFPMIFVSGIILGGMMSIFSHMLLGVYLSVLLFYFLLAVVFGIKDGKSVRLLPFLVVIYAVIHLSYGWGYWLGIYKLCTHQSFIVKVNR